MFEIPTKERLLIYGPKMVNVVSKDVEYDEFDLLPLLREYMFGVMNRNHGIGLASPQVGIFKNFFIMQTSTGKLIDLVNPEIVQMYGQELEGFEACLSLPPIGNGCKVPRMTKIRVECSEAENPSTRKILELSGMDAIVAQHEIDHLTGTFFIDRVCSKKREAVLHSFNVWKMSLQGAPQCSVQSPSIPLS